MRDAGMPRHILDRCWARRRQTAQNRRVTRSVIELRIPIGLFHRTIEKLDQVTQQGTKRAMRGIHAPYVTALLYMAKRIMPAS